MANAAAKGYGVGRGQRLGASMSEQNENEKPDSSREGYDWPSIALFFIFLGAFIYAFLQR